MTVPEFLLGYLGIGSVFSGARILEDESGDTCDWCNALVRFVIYFLAWPFPILYWLEESTQKKPRRPKQLTPLVLDQMYRTQQFYASLVLCAYLVGMGWCAYKVHSWGWWTGSTPQAAVLLVNLFAVSAFLALLYVRALRLRAKNLLMTIQCAWCEQPIFVGDGVTLYSPANPDRAMPASAVPYGDNPKRYVGCMRRACTHTFADRAGLWVAGENGKGRVKRVCSPYELILQGGEPVIVEDAHNLSAARATA